MILSTSLGLLAATVALAGPEAKKEIPVEKKAEQKGLVFANGKLTIDIEERLRFEIRDNNRDFDSSINDDNDDSWLLNRARLGIGFNPVSWLKFYAQAQDAREWDSDRPNIPGVRGTEGGDFDLRQGYVEFADYKQFPLGLKIGRQLLDYGDNRLVADAKWANFGRTFDAVKLRYEEPHQFWVEAFAARVVQIREEVFNDSDSADNLFGLYASFDYLKFQTTELYAFHRDKQDNQPDLDPTNVFDAQGSWNGPAQRITTIGTRWASKKEVVAPWDYGFEAVYQFGEVWANDRNAPSLDQSAFAVHVHGGYTWEEVAWKPRIGLEYNYGSGDDNPADGDSGSFQNLYPSNFAPYGYIDFFSWRNMHNARVQFTVEPTKTFKAELSYHAFWLAETSDYWFRSNGYGTVRTRTPDGRDVRTVGASNFAGHEIDLQLTWKATDYLTILGGYSHFFAGQYLSDTGTDDDADFGYLQVSLIF